VSEGPPAATDPLGTPPTGPLDRVAGDSTGRGIAFALLAAIAGMVVAASCLVVPVVGQWLCIAFGGAPGLAQLAWIVPLDRWASRRGRSRLRKGLWIGASVVFLLNSACWGLVTTQFRM
jgi:hypothetical protein